jgi:hypothetical protein
MREEPGKEEEEEDLPNRQGIGLKVELREREKER